MSHRLKHMVDIYQKHLKVGLQLNANGMKFPGSRIAIMPDVPPETTAGGIIVPDTAIKGAPAVGTVVGVGFNMESEEYIEGADSLKIASGHRVAFSKYGGVKIDLFLNGADEPPTEVQLLAPNDIYVYWDPRVGTELDNDVG